MMVRHADNLECATLKFQGALSVLNGRFIEYLADRITQGNGKHGL